MNGQISARGLELYRRVGRVQEWLARIDWVMDRARAGARRVVWALVMRRLWDAYRREACATTDHEIERGERACFCGARREP